MARGGLRALSGLARSPQKAARGHSTDPQMARRRAHLLQPLVFPP